MLVLMVIFSCESNLFPHSVLPLSITFCFLFIFHLFFRGTHEDTPEENEENKETAATVPFRQLFRFATNR